MRKRTPTAHPDRSSLGLSISSSDQPYPRAAPAQPERDDKGDRLEGPASIASALLQAPGSRKIQAAGPHRRWPRARRLHLGNWRRGRTSLSSSPCVGRVIERRSVAQAQTGRGRAAHGKGEPSSILCDRPTAELTLLVRGALSTDHDHDGEPPSSIREYQSDRLSR